MSDSFYWHDYETTGADTVRDRPIQFAGLRTDRELEPIGEPLVLFARLSPDILPQPEACLVTGITPQRAAESGLSEAEFTRRVHAELALPGTCAVGYNSLRFDDEITRQTLYRNFYDPYAREWQNGNSRWDIIDMLRAAQALRPQGIEWPLREDGLPSFRLEDLTAANGIGHESAHDALSDVRATIALARLVRERQPRLFHYALSHRDKRSVLSLLDLDRMKPVLHVSGMFGAARHNIALVVPLAAHPHNRNEMICYDLSVEPAPLLELDPAQLSALLYTPASELPEGVERPGLKSVHVNRCPLLVTAKMADASTAERLGIDGARCRSHLATLRMAKERDPEGFAARVQAVVTGREFEPVDDPERQLYSGGFFSDRDRRAMDEVRDSSAAELAEASWSFEDGRLEELLFRYRARNYPESLTPDERERWEAYRYRRLTEADGGGSLCLEEFQQRVEERLLDSGTSARDRDILQALLDYGDQLLA